MKGPSGERQEGEEKGERVVSALEVPAPSAVLKLGS